MLEQYPKLKKLLPYFPLYLLFAIGCYVFFKTSESLYNVLFTISFLISLPITYYICRFVNNSEIIEKIKYSPKITHELLYMLITFCQLPLWIAVIWTLITLSEMIAK